MVDKPLVWPEDHAALEAVTSWVASVSSDDPGPPEILQVKRWGVTARFKSLVLKISFTPLFPQVTDVHALLERAVPGRVPRLIASEMLNGQLWTLFEHLPGLTAEQVGTPEALTAIARELATVQVAATKQDLSQVPTIPVSDVPQLLLDDIEDQPTELITWLHDAQPALQNDADALAIIPSSFDHPDVNSSNAIIQDDSSAVLIDWEEVTVGCPLFSLDRLLQDAREHSAIDLVTEAYLEVLPWGERKDVQRAMRLVPLKLAVEARAFARGLGWSHPHTRYTTRLLHQAQKRCIDGYT